MQYQIRQLDNDALLQKTKALAVQERKLTLEILHHLQEIYRRRLYATRGFSSLSKYATCELGYSDAAAHRRISAMMLLSEIPEVEKKIEEGAITLSNAAQAQKLFQMEAKLNNPFDIDKKKKILENLTHKSSRQAETELIQYSSQPIFIQKPDKVKPVTPTHSEIRFIADQSLLDQLDLIKGLLANKHSHLTLNELFAEMAKLSLEKLQPKPPKAALRESKNRSGAGAAAPVDERRPAHSVAQEVAGQGVTQKVEPEEASNNIQLDTKDKATRYIPVEVKRTVYQRDEGQCQYVDTTTGRKCASIHAIQHEHITPYAMGGQSTVENLQLLCSMHNRIRAIEVYGEKMSTYIQLD